MRLGIAIEDTWDFFHEVYAYLAEHHQTSLFERRTFSLPMFNTRINRALFRQDLQRFLRGNQVVFFEWASALLAAASHLKKQSGIVTRLHRYEMYQWADQINWEAVDRIILVSRAKEREFASRFPDQASKVVVIPESISLERFQPHSKPFNGDIGILCHLRPRKRVYELILAFHELCQNEKGMHLHIGGGSPSGSDEYLQALRTLVQQLNLGDRVTFYGPIANPQEWYRRIDIFISNSYSEGLQVSPMEAIASGCYCLSHHWDGAEELLPEGNLFFTERELVALLQQYCEAPEEEKQRRKDRLRARAADQFDVDKIKVQIRDVIEEVAAGR